MGDGGRDVPGNRWNGDGVQCVGEDTNVVIEISYWVVGTPS